MIMTKHRFPLALVAALAVAEVDGVALDVGDADHGLAEVGGRL